MAPQSSIASCSSAEHSGVRNLSLCQPPQLTPSPSAMPADCSPADCSPRSRSRVRYHRAQSRGCVRCPLASTQYPRPRLASWGMWGPFRTSLIGRQRAASFHMGSWRSQVFFFSWGLVLGSIHFLCVTVLLFCTLSGSAFCDFL